MKRFLLFFIFVSCIFSGCSDKTEGEINLVTAEEMQAIMEMEDVHLVDVRSAKERENGFIKSSQNIDFNSPTFEADIEKLDKSKPVILYCRSGRRSAECAEILIDAGFVKVYDLKGGMTQWLFEDRAVELAN